MDLAWTNDMDLFAAETTSDLEECEQDCYHVIEQDLGSNQDDPTRGLGAANILSKAIPNGFRVNAENEIQKDDRVNSCTAELSEDAQGNAQLDLAINVDANILNLTVPIGGSNT